MAVGDKRFVAVIKIVWLRTSSNESVGVEVATGKVATLVGLSVAVESNTIAWGVGSTRIVSVGVGRCVGRAVGGELSVIGLTTGGIVMEAIGVSYSFDAVLQPDIIKIVMSSTKIVRQFHVK